MEAPIKRQPEEYQLEAQIKHQPNEFQLEAPIKFQILIGSSDKTLTKEKIGSSGKILNQEIQCIVNNKFMLRKIKQLITKFSIFETFLI